MNIIKKLPLLACLCASMVSAQFERLDDSASAQSNVEARTVSSETGMPLSESPSAKFAISDFGLVRYRLATAAYKGKAAKIYYVIPAAIDSLRDPKALVVTWKGNGQFADGEGHAGERKLVWSGSVTSDWMEEAFNLQMQVELAQLRLLQGQAFSFESYFEIEPLP